MNTFLRNSKYINIEYNCQFEVYDNSSMACFRILYICNGSDCSVLYFPYKLPKFCNTLLKYGTYSCITIVYLWNPKTGGIIDHSFLSKEKAYKWNTKNCCAVLSNDALLWKWIFFPSLSDAELYQCMWSGIHIHW